MRQNCGALSELYSSIMEPVVLSPNGPFYSRIRGPLYELGCSIVEPAVHSPNGPVL